MHLTEIGFIVLCVSIAGIEHAIGFDGPRHLKRLKKTVESLNSEAYLEKFGWLDMPTEGTQHDEHSRTDAIKKFQKFAGLEITGQMNQATKEKMLAPRCGLPDVIKPENRIPHTNTTEGKTNRPLSFYAPGYKWEKSALTYRFEGFSRQPQIPQASQRKAIKRAFSKWSDITPLSFREVSSGDADILINWIARDHSDGSPFDGRGGTLAHAFFPGQVPISGDTHFDEDEEWTENTSEGTNLEIVAAHEFGHAIGLGHSGIKGALMQPFYSGYDANFKLHYDDISGIQTLYGSRPVNQPTPPVPVTTQRRPVTGQSRTTTQSSSRADGICSLAFDDISTGPDGRLYAFRLKNVYKFNANGVGIEQGFPVTIQSVFPKAPNHIGAAVYDRLKGKFYIFRGSQYFRYSYTNTFQLDVGFPKTLTGWYMNIEAAIQEDNGEIRVLKGKEVSVWREDFLQPPRGYPINIVILWNGLRSDLEAAVRYQRVSYFFKGKNYFKWSDRSGKVDYRKEKAGPWLGCGKVEPK